MVDRGKINGINTITFTFALESISERVYAITQYSGLSKEKVAMMMNQDKDEIIINNATDCLYHVSDILAIVNISAITPVVVTPTDYIISVSDWGNARDSHLAVIDNLIKQAMVNYIAKEWFSINGENDLFKKYDLAYRELMVKIRNYLYGLLKKKGVAG